MKVFGPFIPQNDAKDPVCRISWHLLVGFWRGPTKPAEWAWGFKTRGETMLLQLRPKKTLPPSANIVKEALVENHWKFAQVRVVTWLKYHSVTTKTAGFEKWPGLHRVMARLPVAVKRWINTFERHTSHGMGEWFRYQNLIHFLQ